MFGLSLFALIMLQVPWWVYLLLPLGPDIGMIGYLVNNRFGAICYNLFHHKGIAILIFVVGVIISDHAGEILNIVGLVLFGHSSMDRALGYGLKLNEGFKYTHLGLLGKK